MELGLDVWITAKIRTVELQACLSIRSIDANDVDLTLAQTADDGDDIFL